MLVKSENIHPNLRQRYVSKVLNDLKVGDNVVTKQAKVVGYTASVSVFIIAICLSQLSGWLTFFGIIFSFFAYPLAFAYTVKDISLKNAERIQMMQIGLPLVCTNQGEKAYCEAFLAVGNTTKLDASQVKAIIRSLNDLLDDYNLLAQQQANIKKFVGNQSSFSINFNVERTEKMIKGSKDDLTRTANERSLSILKSQVSDIEALETNITRTNSQQNVVINALNSIPTTLGRAQAASHTMESPDIDRISSVSRQINQETKALEMAIQEVMAAVRA